VQRDVGVDNKTTNVDDYKRERSGAMKPPANWEHIDTGGNCTAWKRELGRAGYALMTQAGDPCAPTSSNQRVVLGIYDQEEDRQRVAFEFRSYHQAVRIAECVSFINEVEF
jgi:hypothetical protein